VALCATFFCLWLVCLVIKQNEIEFCLLNVQLRGC
jgi:hypothetical protein